MLFETFRSHDPQRIALQDARTVLRYGDLEACVEERRRALPDVRVLGVALDNGVEWVLWDLAALKAGIPCVPLPPFFTPAQVEHALQTAGVTHVVSSEGLRCTGVSAQSFLPTGTAKVTFTSGTTGAPKGVCLPRQAMECVASDIVDLLGADLAGGVHLCVLPLAVLLENVAGVYAALMAGCTVRFVALGTFGRAYDGLYNVLRNTGATSAILVPEILRTLMGRLAGVPGALPDLKFVAVGGSKVDPALILRARAMGLPVYEGYGVSECASVVALNMPQSDKPGTVGQVLPHVQLRIVDGGIQIQYPGFLGYIGDGAPEVFDTGDLGVLDGDGFLSVTGRRKNVLITSYGRNVSPEWVESVLLAQPAIAQAVVYGDAQPFLSALIVCAGGHVDVRKAVEAANTTLPEYAQVQDFQIVPPFTVEEGTLTGTGRPRRERILTHYAKETSHDVFQQAG